MTGCVKPVQEAVGGGSLGSTSLKSTYVVKGTLSCDQPFKEFAATANLSTS